MLAAKTKGWSETRRAEVTPENGSREEREAPTGGLSLIIFQFRSCSYHWIMKLALASVLVNIVFSLRAKVNRWRDHFALL